MSPDKVVARIRYCQALNLMVLIGYFYERSVVVLWTVNILIVLAMLVLLVLAGRRLKPVLDKLSADDPLEGTFFARDHFARSDRP